MSPRLPKLIEFVGTAPVSAQHAFWRVQREERRALIDGIVGRDIANAMSLDSPPPRSVPFGTLLLLALVCVLYVVMLAQISFSTGRGDASMGQALAAFFFTVSLWVASAILMAVGAIMGQMPRWVAIASIVVVPLAGVATFVAIDMCSRHIKWAAAVPVLLPVLVAFYAVWARWPKLRAMLPAKAYSIANWGTIVVVSVATLWLAM